MADLTITVANVAYASGQKETGTAGATITAGDAVYADSADSGKYKPADCTTSAATATIVGVALHGSLDEQPLTILKVKGTLDVGATLTVGETYVLSVNGAIAPVADLATNDYVSYVGYATAADVLNLSILKATGVQVP